jgi:hypothetical protein
LRGISLPSHATRTVAFAIAPMQSKTVAFVPMPASMPSCAPPFGGSVVAGESGGTSRWSHGLGYLFSALRRDGLIPDKLSLNLSALLRSLNLFLKLRV